MKKPVKHQNLWHLILLSFCGLAVLAAVFTFAMKAAKKSIFPGANDRYDVTLLQIAPLRDACPLLGDDLAVSSLQQCIQSLKREGSTSLLRPLKLLTLEEQATNYHDKFQDYVAKQGLDSVREALLAKSPIVVKMEVPRRYFSVDRLGETPHVLVVGPSGDMRICYLETCPHATVPGEIPALKFPLFADASVTDPMIDLWMFIRTPETPFGLNLQYGLFVTDPRTMRPVERIHFSLTNSSELLAAILLLGIALMATLYALLWADYLDFIAYAIFSTSQFFVCMVPVLVMIGTNWTYNHPFRNALNIGSELNVLLSGTFFAWATLRPPTRIFWRAWATFFMFVLAVALTIALYPIEDALKRQILFGSALCSLVIPATISLWGGFWVRGRLLAQAQRGVASSREEANRRLHEQMMMAGALFLCATPVLIRRVINLFGYWTYDLATLRSIAMFPLFGILLYTASSKFRARAEAYRKDLVDMARQAAIGDMVQMLAHDVRKPFSLLRIGIDLMGKAANFEEMRSVLSKLTPQVRQSLSAVTGMLTDIMNVNSTPKLAVEPVSMTNLIGPILRDLKIRHPTLHVSIAYEFAHQRRLLIDVDKMSRVFSNILDNAVQAMGRRGRLWIHTKDLGRNQSLCEVTIGNSGSYIDEKDRERIFDTFFTKDKKGGTGLGLAVARKFCELHGGQIRCRSDRFKGTEFVLLLPTADGASAESVTALPRHSDEIASGLEATRDDGENGGEQGGSFTQHLLEEIVSYLAKRQNPIRVMIVENESLYAAALKKNLVSILPGVPLTIVETADPEWAFDQALEQTVHLIFLDIDLGHDREDGLTLCQRLRAEGIGSYLCVHSNRALPQDMQRALDSGADKFIQKPIRYQDLVLLLGEVIQSQEARGFDDGQSQTLMIKTL